MDNMEEFASDDEVAGEMMPNIGDHDHHHHHEPFSNDDSDIDIVDYANGVRDMSTNYVVLSDPDVLHCSICNEPLTIPVFQCKNGHIACSACSYNLCQMCFTPIGSGRCRAIESVLECIKVSCHNEKYGCNKTISYSEKKNHEEECIFAPCYCPFSGCNFVASSEVFSTHVREKHEASSSRIQFSYDQYFSVSFNYDAETIVLQEQSDGTLFVLNKDAWRLGIVVSISCIGPKNLSSESGYHYDISAKSQRCDVKLESYTNNVQRKSLAYLSSVFLVIPFDFDSPEPLNLDICIRNRHNATHSHE